MRALRTWAAVILLNLGCPAEAQNAPPKPLNIPSGAYGKGALPTPSQIHPGPLETAAEIFSHETSRADYLKQSTTQLVTTLKNELWSLRSHMKAALVDKDLSPNGFIPHTSPCWIILGGTAGPSVGCDNPPGKSASPCESSSDSNPCPGCGRLKSGEFDRWFDGHVAYFDFLTSLEDENFAAWESERAKKHQEIDARKLTHLDEGAVWLARENAFYREIYRAVVIQAAIVWRMYVGEVLGADRVGSLRDFVVAGYPPGTFPGQIVQYETEIQKALFPAYAKLRPIGCDVETAWREFMDASDGGKVVKEGRWKQKVDELKEEMARCASAEEAQRDQYAPVARMLRNRLHEVQARLRKEAQTWRRMIVASHVYAGEGNAAISDVYGNGREFAMDGNSEIGWMSDFPFSGGRGNQKMSRAPLSSSSSRTDPGAVQLSIPKTCLQSAAVKYPDIEKYPFQYSLGDFNSDWSPSRGTRSLTALGGRMPDEGP